MSTLQTIIQRGTAAAQPSASSVPIGTLYFQTDTSLIQRSNGSTWDSYSASASTSKIAQVVSSETGAVATGTTIIPFDDTIPQITEGDQYMSLAITPTSATNKLIIEVIVFATVTATPWITVALFQDSTANSLAAVSRFVNLSTTGSAIPLRHIMTAGTTSATTFKIRVGPSGASTLTFNGQSSGRIFGGIAASSIVITEYVP